MTEARRKTRIRRRSARVLIAPVLGAIFLLANAGLCAYYAERTYPQTAVMGSDVGNLAYEDLEDQLRAIGLVPDRLVLAHEDRSVEVALADLGVSAAYDRLGSGARASHTWLPLVSIFAKQTLDAPVRVDAQRLRRRGQALATAFHRPPVNAHLTLDGGAFAVVGPQDGHDLDVERLSPAVLQALNAGRRTLTVPVTVVAADPQPPDLEETRDALQRQLGASLTYRYRGTSVQATPQEISGWYLPSGDAYALSDARVRSYLVGVGDGVGIRPRDLGQLVAGTKRAVSSAGVFEADLVPFARSLTFTYCVAGRNVESRYLAGFASAAGAAYEDPRGWSLDGQVAFKKVDRNCDFTLWLSAAVDVPGFSAGCDAEWSCRVGDNVIINFDRWQDASPAWRLAGGALEDYRSMVINHETGHWLGFGHADCVAGGQPAAVMQQQSIDLQGCAFSAWPTPGEHAILRRLMGL